MGSLKLEYKWKMFIVTALANLTAGFALNSINLALPVMAEEFGVSMGTISWLSLVYSFIPSCTLLIFGRAADLYGYKKQFIGGFIVFGLASLLLPILSVNLPVLILFRSIQAIGYGMLISITQAMCNRTFPASERGKALGVNSVFVSVGLATGPTIGGILLSRFSWRAIFYFNVPLCILGVAASLAVLKPDIIDPDKDRRMDWIGSALFALSIGTLAAAINFSDDWGFASVKFLACLGVAVLSLGAFILRESRADMPLMHLNLFKERTFSLANCASVFSYMSQQMNTFLTPFFLMNILLISKSDSGFIMLATPLSMMLLSPVGGRMADKYGSRRPSAIGLAIIIFGCVLMSLLKESSTVYYVIGALICFGIGNGLSVSAINTAIFSAVPKEHSGVASGMVATMRNLGQGLGVAFGGAIIAMRERAYLAKLAAGSGNEAYLLAQRDAFYFGICIVIISLTCMLLTPNARKKKS